MVIGVWVIGFWTRRSLGTYEAKGWVYVPGRVGLVNPGSAGPVSNSRRSSVSRPDRRTLRAGSDRSGRRRVNRMEDSLHKEPRPTANLRSAGPRPEETKVPPPPVPSLIR